MCKSAFSRDCSHRKKNSVLVKCGIKQVQIQVNGPKRAFVCIRKYVLAAVPVGHAKVSLAERVAVMKKQRLGQNVA